MENFLSRFFVGSGQAYQYLQAIDDGAVVTTYDKQNVANRLEQNLENISSKSTTPTSY